MVGRVSKTTKQHTCTQRPQFFDLLSHCLFCVGNYWAMNSNGLYWGCDDYNSGGFTRHQLWFHPLAWQFVGCAGPALNFANISTCPSLHYGQSCYFSCLPGYVLGGGYASHIFLSPSRLFAQLSA